jgi:MOSC domain-containing protein YiiM
MSDPLLVSVQVGAVATHGSFEAVDPLDKRWTTGFFKSPVVGPVAASWLGLFGDEQADPRFHGGPDKAVLAYSEDHFADWRKLPELAALAGGGFGENLTIRGQSEADVCIGDVWRVGSVLLEITQPRQPCFKLGRRWRKPNLPKRVIALGRTGWYFRVKEEGLLEAGQRMTLESRPQPKWTIAEANRLMYDKRPLESRLREFIALPELSQAWKDELGERIAGD